MTLTNEGEIKNILLRAIQFRQPLIEEGQNCAFRLFNGFYEGIEDLVIDVYGQTLVMFSHFAEPGESTLVVQTARDLLLEALPWVRSVVVKHHQADDVQLKCGVITFGSVIDNRIQEHGVQYAVDLLLNQDAGFYLDTRFLRAWLIQHCKDADVLNTFAYTGSLGIAALAGGARHVHQLDRNPRFLEIARQSAILNRFDLGKMKCKAVDFFVGIGQFKRSGQRFDLAILDPPFFSTSEKGRVDQLTESVRLINKIRPLIKDGGRLVTINNALFLEGRQFQRTLEALAQDGYVEIEELIPVPEDITGYPETILQKPPANPAPFNHPTKIAVLKIKRKGP